MKTCKTWERAMETCKTCMYYPRLTPELVSPTVDCGLCQVNPPTHHISAAGFGIDPTVLGSRPKCMVYLSRVKPDWVIRDEGGVDD